jgi:hypothetical protein
MYDYKGSFYAPGEWTVDIAKHIKSLAPKTLVMDGSFSRTGDPSTAWPTEALESEYVDLLSYHFYGTVSLAIGASLKGLRGIPGRRFERPGLLGKGQQLQQDVSLFATERTYLNIPQQLHHRRSRLLWVLQRLYGLLVTRSCVQMHKRRTSRPSKTALRLSAWQAC